MPSNRGGGGGGRGGPQPRDVLVSKKLSWLLRHGAEKEGLVLGKGGYVGLDDVLQNRNIRSLKTSLAEIRQIVASNEKQRFSLIHISALESPDTTASSTPTETTTNDDNDPTHYLIRANQGHSIPLDSADLLTPISLDDPSSLPAMVVHGTRHDAWSLILESGGLKRMRRNHVHFATGVPEQLQSLFQQKSSDQGAPAETTSQVEGANADMEPEQANGNDGDVASLESAQPAQTVLSGMRNSSTILIYINLRAALEAGLKFYKSENGVVLSEGDAEKSVVSIDFFEKVQEKGGRVLVKDGKVVAEADAVMLERARKGAEARGGRGGGGRGRGGRGRGRGRGGREGHGEGGRQGEGQGDNDASEGRLPSGGRGGMTVREARRGPLGVADDN